MKAQPKKGRGRPRKQMTVEKRHTHLPEGGVSAALSVSWQKAVDTLAQWENLEEVVGPAFVFDHPVAVASNEKFECRVMVTRVRKTRAPKVVTRVRKQKKGK